MLASSHKPMSRLRIALVADTLTYESLQDECHIAYITPRNHRLRLPLFKPDLLLVESTWRGLRNRWRYKVASYPDTPSRTNADLQALVQYANKRGIPTVFWNKEDPVHFDRFADSAVLFDHIFTVDSTSIPQYQRIAPHAKTHALMMFAVQPRIHSYTGFAPSEASASFVGSYLANTHERRRMWQDMLFSAAASTTGLTVFDRNSKLTAPFYRFPERSGMAVQAAVPYAETANIYRRHIANLNVNTIEASPTMLSRRLMEIVATGGLAVSSPSEAASLMLGDYAHIVSTEDEANALLERLSKDGPSAQDRARIEAGAHYMTENHTWAHRLSYLADTVGLGA